MWNWYLMSRQGLQGNFKNVSVFDPPCLPYALNSIDFIKKQHQQHLGLNNIPFIPSQISKYDTTKSEHHQINMFQAPMSSLHEEQKKKDDTSKICLPQKKKQKAQKSKKITETKPLHGRNPGRNSTSNIFRVFVKLCSKSKFQGILKSKFQSLSALKSFYISFQYFKIRVKQLAPPTSNYINVKEFKKSSQGRCQFSRAFRCLFHWFVKNYASAHCLTLKGKHRMMKESILSFLDNLHQIQNQLWGCQEFQQQIGREEVKIQQTQ